MNQKQFDQVILLSAQERYDHFISRAADWEEVWTLKSPDGFVMFGDSSGRECIPVWPHSHYAAALINDSWSACIIMERLDLHKFLEKWIPGMVKDKRMVVVFPTPDEKGVVINPKRLKEDLLEELKLYE
jgi:hypothetical protein